MKTNAMRILDNLGISYEILEYSYNEESLGALHVSKTLGIMPEQIFKTIVMKNNSNKLFVFCLPADFSISLKKARVLTNSNDIELLKTEDLQKYTGYIRGGCSPLGMIKKYPTFIEETANLEDFICVSAGVRGCMLKIQPNDLQKACDGVLCDFV